MRTHPLLGRFVFPLFFPVFFFWLDKIVAQSDFSLGGITPVVKNLRNN